MTTHWNTQVQYLPFEAHPVFFQPLDDPGGTANCIAIQIPETPTNLLKRALQQATKLNARIVILCDTPQQANKTAAFAMPRLPNHRRFPIERARAGGWEPIS